MDEEKLATNGIIFLVLYYSIKSGVVCIKLFRFFSTLGTSENGEGDIKNCVPKILKLLVDFSSFHKHFRNF